MFRKLAIVSAFFVLTVCARPSFGAQLDCAYTFTSQPGKPVLNFCVSPTGTLTTLTMPSGPELISQNWIGPAGFLEGGDGYGLCTESPATAYWDYVNDVNESNWGAATMVSHTATTVTFARTTSDGFWTLTQTFTADTRTPGVKLAMALKNNTTSSLRAYLLRFVISSNFGAYSSTRDRTFAFFSTTPDTFGYGLSVQNQTTPQFGYMNGFAYYLGKISRWGPNPCDFAAGSATNGPILWPGPGGGNSLVYAGPVAAGKTRTATIFYSGMY